MKNIITLFILLATLHCNADRCQSVTKDWAEKSVNYLKKHKEIIFWIAHMPDDKKELIKYSEVYFKPSTKLDWAFNVIIVSIGSNGKKKETYLDLAYVYVKIKNKAVPLNKEINIDCGTEYKPFIWEDSLTLAKNEQIKLSKVKKESNTSAKIIRTSKYNFDSKSYDITTRSPIYSLVIYGTDKSDSTSTFVTIKSDSAKGKNSLSIKPVYLSVQYPKSVVIQVTNFGKPLRIYFEGGLVTSFETTTFVRAENALEYDVNPEQITMLANHNAIYFECENAKVDVNLESKTYFMDFLKLLNLTK